MPLAICALCSSVATAGTSDTEAVLQPSTEATRAEVQDLAPADLAEQKAVHFAALNAAAQAGDPTPTNVKMAVTTMGRATVLAEHGQSSATNSIVDPCTDQPWVESAVFIVTMHGHFKLTDVPLREGEELPSGEIMTLIIDRQLGRGVGIYVGDTSDDLSDLGVPVTAWENQ